MLPGPFACQVHAEELVEALGPLSVRLFVMGEEAWRDLAAWPPPGYQPCRFHLRAGGALSSEAPTDAEPDRYRYDPADPTPAVGGVRMAVGEKSGRVDNAKRCPDLYH